jgi:putative CocE/NonD family hydrolase
VIFGRGVADELLPDDIGQPVGTFAEWFDVWPPPETVETRFYFNADGSLRPTPPVEEASASVFAHDPEAGERTLGGDQPFYDWAPTAAGSAIVFESDVLLEDTVMVGTGSVDLWLRSSEPDADIEVLLSEVRPDDFETYVQAGWLRASHRALAEDATALDPVKTHLEADAEDLDPDEWNMARVELMPFGHVFRAGSRIRLQIDTPGDSRERWRFLLQEYESEDVKHYVAHSATNRSSILLPVIPGIVVPTDLPPCPGLRGQPCRTWEPYVNTLELP